MNVQEGNLPPTSEGTLGEQNRSHPQSRETKNNFQRPKAKKPVLEEREEVNTELGHGMGRRKS